METTIAFSSQAINPVHKSLWTQLLDLNRAYSSKQVAVALAEVEEEDFFEAAVERRFKPLTLWL